MNTKFVNVIKNFKKKQSDSDEQKQELLDKYQNKNAMFLRNKIPMFATDQKKKDKMDEKTFSGFVDQLSDKNFLKLAHFVYYGVPEDNRPLEQKKSDAFVIFLIHCIDMMDNGVYVESIMNNIDIVLAISNNQKVFNGDIKILMFKILLQQVKNSILISSDETKEKDKKKESITAIKV